MTRLAAVIEREPGASAGHALIARWLGRGAEEDPAWIDALIDVARSGQADARPTWELRRIATLILEHEALRGSDAQLEEICARLGLDATQMRPRLARNARVHDGIRGPRTPPAALEAFLRLARSECRLTFARALFTPAEIAERIERHVRIAPAVRDGLSNAPQPFASSDAEQVLDSLPELERTLLRALGEPARSYWVSDDTPSAINSLIEYPTGTVALTIKPPGSSIEFEIKRAGQRGPAVLGAACKPHQWTRSHYMRGAASKHILIWETSSAEFVSRAWRLVHGGEAPVSRTLYLVNVTDVPAEGGSVNILRYFTDPSFHNGDFDEMRRAMRGAVGEELYREGGHLPVPEHDGPLTGAFVGLIHPGQSIMTGSTSFRLDVLARGLAEGDSSATADELLDEVLATYTPPRTRARTVDRYVAAALRANRERADACYIEVLRQYGHFWGTMTALRVGTNGESFVPRNVGLRSVWENGRWQLRVIFMDHDGMFVPGLQERDFHPANLARPMMNDYRHIFGGRIPGAVIAGALASIEAIYRPARPLARTARSIVCTAARMAYDTTMSAFMTNAKLRDLYGERFVERHRDWDTAVSSYLVTARGERKVWESKTRERLSAAGYGPEGVESFVKTIRGFDVLIRKTAFLYVDS